MLCVRFMKHGTSLPLVLALATFGLGCGSSDTITTPPADTSMTDSPADSINTDSGPNLCTAAGGKCAKEAESFSCDSFGAGWLAVAPGSALYSTCGGTPVPDGSAIPSRLYPCCLLTSVDAGSDADATDVSDTGDAGFKLAGCGVTCASTEVCEYPYPPGICPSPGTDGGACPAGCPGCPSLPPPSCKALPTDCASAPTCDCLVKKICSSFGGTCEKHPSEFVVSCLSG